MASGQWPLPAMGIVPIPGGVHGFSLYGFKQFDVVQFAPRRRDTRASSRWFPPPCHRPASSASSRPSNLIPASIRSGAIEEYPIRIC